MRRFILSVLIVFALVFAGCNSDYDELENAIEEQELTGNEEDPVEKIDPRNY